MWGQRNGWVPSHGGPTACRGQCGDTWSSKGHPLYTTPPWLNAWADGCWRDPQPPPGSTAWPQSEAARCRCGGCPWAPGWCTSVPCGTGGRGVARASVPTLSPGDTIGENAPFSRLPAVVDKRRAGSTRAHWAPAKGPLGSVFDWSHRNLHHGWAGGGDGGASGRCMARSRGRRPLAPSSPPPPPCLVLPCTTGRAPGADGISIRADGTLSSKHMAISFDDHLGHFVVEDLGSRNGTVVEGPSSFPVRRAVLCCWLLQRCLPQEQCLPASVSAST